jgi:hypothetical protein
MSSREEGIQPSERSPLTFAPDQSLGADHRPLRPLVRHVWSSPLAKGAVRLGQREMAFELKVL